FLQAEDGIRVFHVTGVQTCALPISRCSGCSATSSWVSRTPNDDADGPGMFALFISVAVIAVAFGGLLAAVDAALSVLSRNDLSEIGRAACRVGGVIRGTGDVALTNH